MDADCKNFGRGPRELSGAVDLINHYKLLPHHEFFCKRSLPLSISETPYLRSVVGDKEIRKGEGMGLDQLFQPTSYLREKEIGIHTFDLDILRDAFQMRETTPVVLPLAEKGIPTSLSKSKSEHKDKERKHKRSKARDKDHKNHRHHHKGSSNGKDKDKSRNGNWDSGLEQKRQTKSNSQIKMGLQRVAR